tara:strand:- start:16 stop:237 length:222 start_codon:yes stop_codon:yes gene_type:complete
MSKKYPRMRNGKFYSGEYMPPYVVLEEEKEVFFLIESGMAYLAIGAFMKHFPDDYKGYRVRDRETFKKYGGKI